jgi:Ca2+-binding RTX toxin-like protein
LLASLPLGTAARKRTSGIDIIHQVQKVLNMASINGTPNADTLTGTPQDDDIKSLEGDDRIIASNGNDKMDGGSGTNTVDYSGLDRAIKTLPLGAIDKGGLGIDTISNIQRIIGATGKGNTVDGSTAKGAGTFDMDLANNSLKVNNTPAGPLSFEVVNFVNAIGTKNNDTIVGSNRNGRLTGGGGNDTIRGGTGNDRITGSDITARGVGEVDTLTGGGGSDRFILGNRDGAFYRGNGNNDYAMITDFNVLRDSIDLGSLRDFSFGIGSGGTIDLFAGKDVNTRDLIAKIQIPGVGASPLAKGSSNAMAGALDGGPALTAPGGIDGISSQINILSGANSTADAVV